MTKKKLVLDIDATMICCLGEAWFTGKDEKPDYLFFLGMDEYYVFKRPYLDKMLDYAFENFEVSICTAATLAYATQVVKALGIEDKISHIISQENLVRDMVPGKYAPSLEWVKVINDAIIIDDRPECVRGTNNRVIAISPYYYSMTNDTAFLDIIQELELLK